MQCLRVTARFRAPLRVRAAWVGRAGMASGARLSARTARQFVGTERLAQANIGAWRPQWSGRTYCTTSEGDISLAEYTKLIEDSLDSLMESFLDIEEAMEIEDFDCELAVRHSLTMHSIRSLSLFLSLSPSLALSSL